MRHPGRGIEQGSFGADGIALSADGSHLWFCPLAGRQLYSVSTDALADPNLPDEQVARTVKREDRKFASDGLEADAQGRLYLTDWEHNAVVVRDPDRKYATLAHDERMWWPDTLSLAADGYLYVTSNQAHRLRKFNGGKDLRRKPFYLFRIRVDGSPVVLR
jgi:sugar lactone lactonase YvrE